MTHRKSFLFKNKHGKFFAVAFVVDNNGKTKAKSIGFRVFPHNDFVDVFSINATTEWLTNSGYTYIKRLPIPDGREYNDLLVHGILRNYK